MSLFLHLPASFLNVYMCGEPAGFPIETWRVAIPKHGGPHPWLREAVEPNRPEYCPFDPLALGNDSAMN